MSAPQAIADRLHALGLTTQQAQADALGLSRVHWNRYANGHQCPSADKLLAWLAAADAAGHTLHLTLDPHTGWTCKHWTAFWDEESGWLYAMKRGAVDSCQRAPLGHTEELNLKIALFGASLGKGAT